MTHEYLVTIHLNSRPIGTGYFKAGNPRVAINRALAKLFTRDSERALGYISRIDRQITRQDPLGVICQLRELPNQPA